LACRKAIRRFDFAQLVTHDQAGGCARLLAAALAVIISVGIGVPWQNAARLAVGLTGR
jgi:hypothetical protein